jgi:hypothetical protein
MNLAAVESVASFGFVPGHFPLDSIIWRLRSSKIMDCFICVFRFSTRTEPALGAGVLDFWTGAHLRAT